MRKLLNKNSNLTLYVVLENVYFVEILLRYVTLQVCTTFIKNRRTNQKLQVICITWNRMELQSITIIKH
jgi:hypothetical protein